MNTCWYVHRVVVVKKKYNLTMDMSEALKAQEILEACISTDLQILVAAEDVESNKIPTPELKPTPQPTIEDSIGHPLELYDDNGNGRITCAEARAHGIAPVHMGHPAYAYMRDGDGDGTVCE